MKWPRKFMRVADLANFITKSTNYYQRKPCHTGEGRKNLVERCEIGGERGDEDPPTGRSMYLSKSLELYMS